MKAYRFLSITLFFILMISPYFTARGEEIEKVEYQVYKAVIEQEYLNKPGYIDLKNIKGKPLLPKTIIIVNQTILGPRIGWPKDLVFKKIENDYAPFSKNALKSWVFNNKEKYKINNKIKFITKHFLISEEQTKEALPLSKRWDSFYDQYPNALGYFRLSRVGFNTDKKTAIVYIENTQDMKWGSGIFWLLKKEKGEWVCTGHVTVYLS